MAVELQDAENAQAPRDTTRRADRRSAAFRSAFSFRSISAVYIWIFIILLFGLWVPDLFLTETTLKSVLTQEAVTGILALGLILPLSAGVYDLSIAYTLGASSVTCAWCMVHADMPVWMAVLVALVLGAAIGCVNGLLVVKFRIDSFIATLGVGSMLAAYIIWLTESQNIVGLSSEFKAISSTSVGGITLPVIYLFVVAVAIWYFLEHTPSGRRLLATGGGKEAARLAGVRTDRFVLLSLVAASTIAAFAGVVVTSTVGTGSPTIGPAYLLPAFAAAFLGATQLKGGRFNVWGTVIAVYLIGTGVKGLDLAGVSFWAKPLFTGAALVLAVGLSVRQKRVKTSSRSTHAAGETATRGAIRKGGG